MFTYKQRLAGECTHRQYFAQFVTPGMRGMVEALLGDDIRESTDPHLNDIPLTRWDHLGKSYRGVIAETNKEINGTRSALSDAGVVCTLKEAAKQIREGSPEQVLSDLGQIGATNV